MKCRNKIVCLFSFKINEAQLGNLIVVVFMPILDTSDEQSTYFFYSNFYKKYRILQVQQILYSLSLAPHDFIMFSKFKIDLSDQTWICGGYKKKYGDNNSYYIKGNLLEVRYVDH